MLTENVTQANKHTLLPVARTKDLIVNELPDEVLVYDLTRHKAHCLNQTAAQIWHLCNGQRTVPEITRTLAQELDRPVDEEVVWLGLGQLSKSCLLEQALGKPDATSRLSRRTAIRRLGMAAAIALPLVISVVAPSAVNAATCVPSGGTFTTSIANCSTATQASTCSSATATRCCNSSPVATPQGTCGTGSVTCTCH
jgi:hypothetical protein